MTGTNFFFCHIEKYVKEVDALSKVELVLEGKILEIYFFVDLEKKNINE